MKNWTSLILTAATLAMMSSVQNARAQSPSQPPNSAQSSPSSDIRVSKPVGNLESRVESKKVPTQDLGLKTPDSLGACMAVAVELERSRILISALESENRLLTERLETEKRTTAILTEL